MNIFVSSLSTRVKKINTLILKAPNDPSQSLLREVNRSLPMTQMHGATSQGITPKWNSILALQESNAHLLATRIVHGDCPIVIHTLSGGHKFMHVSTLYQTSIDITIMGDSFRDVYHVRLTLAIIFVHIFLSIDTNTKYA